MCAVIEAIGQTFFDSVWELINMIRWGRLDVYLTRPAPVLLQVLGEYMFFQAILATVVYVSIFLWAAWKIGLSFGGYEVLLLLEYLVCGNHYQFRHLPDFQLSELLADPGRRYGSAGADLPEFVKYPLNVFPAAIQGFFTYILPLGFVAYYPAMALLGKTDLPVAGLMPLAAGVVTLLAALIWRAGLRSYDSTGT